MNILAFILAITGAGLSLFQPIISDVFMELRVFDFLSAPSSDLKTAACVVLIIAVIAAICGVCALIRKGQGCAFGLFVCGALYLISASLFTGPSNRNEFTSAMSGMAMSVWMKTVLVWALCYIGAGICALLDKPEESTSTTSATSTSSTTATATTAQDITPNVQSSPSNAHKTFEPVLGVETSALIKRAYLFLSEDDFYEADRYFEQAVRQDPENSTAYIGKLLVKLRLHNTDELCNIAAPLTEYKFFQYAMRFANENEKAELQKYLEANAMHIEAMKQEEQLRQEEEIRRKELEELTKKYDEAVRVSRSGEKSHDSKALYHAAEMFDELGDFKDSKILAESAREKAEKEKEKFNEANGLIFIFVLIAIIVIIALNYR